MGRRVGYGLGRRTIGGPNAYSKEALAFYRALGSRQTSQDRNRAAAHGYTPAPKVSKQELENRAALLRIAADRKRQAAKEKAANDAKNRGTTGPGLGNPGNLGKPSGGKSDGGPRPPKPKPKREQNEYAKNVKALQTALYFQALDRNAKLMQEGGGVDDWLRDVAAHEGIPEEEIPAWKQGLGVESSNFDPNAINTWDENARRGTPSIGPAQVIQPTFDAYAEPGWDIYNPRHNIAAGSRYARSRYGDNWLRAMIYGHDLQPGGRTGY